MKTKCILSMLLMLMLLSMHAQSQETLHVQMTDGSETTIMLNTHPIVSFVADQMVITSDRQTIEIPYDKVVRFTYSTDDLSSIPDVTMDLEREGEYILFPEGTTTDDVSVYSTDGRRMAVSLHNNGRRTVLGCRCF